MNTKNENGELQAWVVAELVKYAKSIKASGLLMEYVTTVAEAEDHDLDLNVDDRMADFAEFVEAVRS